MGIFLGHEFWRQTGLIKSKAWISVDQKRNVVGQYFPRLWPSWLFESKWPLDRDKQTEYHLGYLLGCSSKNELSWIELKYFPQKILLLDLLMIYKILPSASFSALTKNAKKKKNLMQSNLLKKFSNSHRFRFIKI